MPLFCKEKARKNPGFNLFFGNNYTVLTFATLINRANRVCMGIFKHIETVAEKFHLKNSVLGRHFGKMEFLCFCDADYLFFKIVERIVFNHKFESVFAQTS